MGVFPIETVITREYKRAYSKKMNFANRQLDSLLANFDTFSLLFDELNDMRSSSHAWSREDYDAASLFAIDTILKHKSHFSLPESITFKRLLKMPSVISLCVSYLMHDVLTCTVSDLKSLYPKVDRKTLAFITIVLLLTSDDSHFQSFDDLLFIFNAKDDKEKVLDTLVQREL